MVTNKEGVCGTCKHYALFNAEDGTGICTKIYGRADYPHGMRFSPEDCDTVIECPEFKEKKRRLSK